MLGVLDVTVYQLASRDWHVFRHVAEEVVSGRKILRCEGLWKHCGDVTSAELPLQRCFNAKTTRRQRVVLALQPERLVLGEDLNV